MIDAALRDQCIYELGAIPAFPQHGAQFACPHPVSLRNLEHGNCQEVPFIARGEHRIGQQFSHNRRRHHYRAVRQRRIKALDVRARQAAEIGDPAVGVNADQARSSLSSSTSIERWTFPRRSRSRRYAPATTTASSPFRRVGVSPRPDTLVACSIRSLGSMTVTLRMCFCDIGNIIPYCTPYCYTA